MLLKKEDKAVPTKGNPIYRYFFSGTFIERIDDKNRVTIPLAWRHLLGDRVIITKNEVGCLVMWTPGFFQWFSSNRVENCATEKERQIVKRLFIGAARTFEIDPKSRITISEDLLSMLALKDQFLYLVGTGDYIEIWSKRLFESWKAKQMPKDTKPEEL